MNNKEIEAFIPLLKRACKDAGEAIMGVYSSRDFEIELKGNHSPLTKADKAAHDCIVEQLNKTGLPILSEEGRDIPYAERKNWPYFWMVDPLDGTKEFIHRNGEFTVNIALIHKGQSIYGAVYVPLTDQLYIGGKGFSLHKEANGQIMEMQSVSRPSWERISSQSGLRVVASRSHLNDETKAFVDSLNQPEIVSMGSSLKFLALIENKADVYPRFAPTMEWDTAAAHAVVESMGYKVYIKGESIPLSYNKPNLLNPHFICFS